MDAGGHVHISPCQHPGCREDAIFPLMAATVESIGADWVPGQVIPVGPHTEVRWLGPMRREPDIHDVVTWDWRRRPQGWGAVELHEWSGFDFHSNALLL